MKSLGMYLLGSGAISNISAFRNKISLVQLKKWFGSTYRCIAKRKTHKRFFHFSWNGRWNHGIVMVPFIRITPISVGQSKLIIIFSLNQRSNH